MSTRIIRVAGVPGSRARIALNTAVIAIAVVLDAGMAAYSWSNTLTSAPYTLPSLRQGSCLLALSATIAAFALVVTGAFLILLGRGRLLWWLHRLALTLTYTHVIAALATTTALFVTKPNLAGYSMLAVTFAATTVSLVVGARDTARRAQRAAAQLTAGSRLGHRPRSRLPPPAWHSFARTHADEPRPPPAQPPGDRVASARHDFCRGTHPAEPAGVGYLDIDPLTLG